MKQNGSSINSIEKAIQILMAFTAEHSSWGVRELSGKLGFSPATVQRALQTLKAYSFVKQDPRTRQYRLGTVFFQFLDILQRTYPIHQTAVPYMERLLSSTQETVHLNAIEGLERICIDSLESSQPLKASMPVGNRSPLYAGASSKCLLAFSPYDFIQHYLNTVSLKPITDRTINDVQKLGTEIAVTKKRGYAVSLGERSPGLGSLSAPVLNHRGVIQAALSLAIPEIRFKDRTYRNYCLMELLTVSKELSHVLGHNDGSPP